MTANNIKNKIDNVKKLHILLLIAFVFSVVVSPLVANNVFAASLTQTTVRFDRMMINTFSTGTVCAKPATTSANVKTWTVTFPTGYAVSTTAANWQTANISTTNLAWPTGGTAWPNATSATASVSGQTVTWTNSSVQSMNNSTLYCYNWTEGTAALKTATSANPSLSGTVATQDNVAAPIDSGTYSTAAIANDQIAVSATVLSLFSFALSGNTDALGTLTTTSPSTGTGLRTATISTNAANGWQVWAKDAYRGLCSPTIGTCTPGTNTTQFVASTAGTLGTLTAGVKGYNTGVVATSVAVGAAVVPDTNYDGGVAYRGGGLDTTLRSIASAAAPSDTAVMTIKNNASIDATVKPASDYADTITIVAAGLF